MGLVSIQTVWPLQSVTQSGVEYGDDDLYRAAIGALDEAMSAQLSDLKRWLEPEPPLTGMAHADALVAAVAEHVAFHRGLDAPAWVEQPQRFLRTVWYPVDLPSIRVRARVSSPASFARRMIYIERIDLERV